MFNSLNLADLDIIVKMLIAAYSLVCIIAGAAIGTYREQQRQRNKSIRVARAKSGTDSVVDMSERAAMEMFIRSSRV